MLAPVNTQLDIKTRNATFHAFHIITHANTQDTDVADFIWETLTNPINYDDQGISSLTTKHQGTGFSVEVRDFHTDGNFAFGCLARCREDSPPLRKPDKSEDPRPLLTGYTLLEKNYFMYSKVDRVLIWQFNLNGNSYSTFASMLNVLSGGNAAFLCAPNINPKEVDFNNIEIEYIDFALSMPTTNKSKQLALEAEGINWGVLNPFKLMSEMGIQRYAAKFTAKRNRPLLEKSIDFLTALATQKTLRKLKLKIEDVDEPIDVLASRFKATHPINYAQGHHDSTSMFAALKDVWAKYEQQAAQN